MSLTFAWLNNSANFKYDFNYTEQDNIDLIDYTFNFTIDTTNASLFGLDCREATLYKTSTSLIIPYTISNCGTTGSILALKDNIAKNSINLYELYLNNSELSPIYSNDQIYSLRRQVNHVSRMRIWQSRWSPFQ